MRVGGAALIINCARGGDYQKVGRRGAPRRAYNEDGSFSLSTESCLRFSKGVAKGGSEALSVDIPLRIKRTLPFVVGDGEFTLCASQYDRSQ